MREQLVKPVGQIVSKHIVTTLENEPKKASTVKSIRPSKLVVTVTQIKEVSNSKILGN